MRRVAQQRHAVGAPALKGIAQVDPCDQGPVHAVEQLVDLGAGSRQRAANIVEIPGGGPGLPPGLRDGTNALRLCTLCTWRACRSR
jgi:hypothetical protein